MHHQEGYFNNIAGQRIYHQAWLPDQPPRAILLVTHGLAEHSGRYMNLVEHFVPLGYAVYALDHSGHGRSEGPRVYVQRFDVFTSTLKQYLDTIRAAHPGLPVFLVGHSMGGLISTVFLLEHQHELSGAILSGPAVKIPDTISPTTLRIARLFSRLMPKAGVAQLELAGLSRDPAVVQAYVDDPLVYTGKTTARLGAEMLSATQRVQAEAGKIQLPLLILQGGSDKLVDPRGAQELFTAVSSPDKTLKIYEGYYHEIFNEPEHKLVLSDLENWLVIQVNSAPALA